MRHFAIVSGVLALLVAAATPAAAQPISAGGTVSVYAMGLNNPRGLKFGPDGNLYVAEGGTGGSNSTTGCDQVIPPVGPYTGSQTGSRISMIDAQGVRTTVADNIPSSQTSAASGSLVSGVADVAFIGSTLYGVLAGAGCSHGVQGIPNGVIRVNADHTWAVIADLSAFQKANPVANPEPDDFEPDGTWYSVIAVNGDLYAVEPNHGELDKITTAGQISRVIDISASQGHIVPTAMTYHDGNFYVGNLHLFPIVEGSSKIYKITPTGQISVVAQGLTTVLGVTFDDRGRMYVLENTTNNAFPTPGTGRVVRVDSSGGLEVIAAGLSVPTAMTFGPDGKLYVSNVGFGPPPIGLGQILRIDIPPDLPAGVTIESLPADATRLKRLLGQLPAIPTSQIVGQSQQAVVIPVAGSIQGANGTFFHSDVTLVNRRAQSQDVLVAWLQEGQDGTNAPSYRITVPSSVLTRSNGLMNTPPTISDFVGRLGLSGVGALVFIGIDSNGNVDPQASINAFSRIWTFQPGSQGTVSQTLSSTGFTDLGLDQGVAPGLRQDAGFRTNVGVLNLDANASDFTIGASGDRKSATISVHVPPLSMIQVPIPAGDYGSVAAGFVSQRAGIRWVGYGSSVDQITGGGWVSEAIPVP
jgi:hypothetical protein